MKNDGKTKLLKKEKLNTIIKIINSINYKLHMSFKIVYTYMYIFIIFFLIIYLITLFIMSTAQFVLLSRKRK